jgi:metal-dependent hydrolase (beta-lactamase superfamily II)
VVRCASVSTLLSPRCWSVRRSGSANGGSALVEVDGHRILLDTGNHPETVLQNAHDLGIDLSNVSEVILTNNHGDHVGGLLTLRREMMKQNPDALSVARVSKASFTVGDCPPVKAIA